MYARAIADDLQELFETQVYVNGSEIRIVCDTGAGCLITLFKITEEVDLGPSAHLCIEFGYDSRRRIDLRECTDHAEILFKLQESLWLGHLETRVTKGGIIVPCLVHKEVYPFPEPSSQHVNCSLTLEELHDEYQGEIVYWSRNLLTMLLYEAIDLWPVFHRLSLRESIDIGTIKLYLGVGAASRLH